MKDKDPVTWVHLAAEDILVSLSLKEEHLARHWDVAFLSFHPGFYLYLEISVFTGLRKQKVGASLILKNKNVNGF